MTRRKPTIPTDTLGEADNPKDCGKCGQPHGRCTAHNRRGTPCGRHPVPGLWVCRMHGGATERAQTAGQRNVLKAEAAKAVARFGLLRDITPADALLEEVRRAAGMVDFYAAKILALDPDTDVDVLTWGEKERKEKVVDGVPVTETKWTAAPAVLVDLWMRERRHYVEVASAAVRTDAELNGSNRGAVVVQLMVPPSAPGAQPTPVIITPPPSMTLPAGGGA